MIDKTMDAVYTIGIYVRESRDDNEENYETIETQRELLVNFVIKNGLGEIINTYIDDNVSGAGFERPGLEMLSEDVKNGVINLVLIKDLSRLGRNNAKTLMFLDFLEEYSVRVITFDGKYDSMRDNDTVGIQTWFNEHYIKDISKKIRANLRFKIEKGEYIGTAPFGYKKALNENRLEIEENTAGIVRFIYEMYLEGYGYRHIANTLNLMSCPTPSMNSHNRLPSITWNSVTIKRILFNRVYIGDTVQGISEKISYKSKKTRRLPENKWVVTRNTHQPIISYETFNAVQKMKASKTLKGMQHKGSLHLLKGVLICGNCGKTMYARRKKNKPMGYICSNYFKFGNKKCSSHYIEEACIIDIIKFEIKNMLASVKKKEEGSKVLDYGKEAKLKLNDQIDRLQKNLLKKQKQQESVYMDKLEGRISDELFKRINIEIENKLSEFKNDLEIKKKKLQKEYDINSEMNLEDIVLTNKMIKFLINKIIIYDKNDNIESYPDISNNRLLKGRKCIIFYFNY